jgi:hypothetical protein
MRCLVVHLLFATKHRTTAHKMGASATAKTRLAAGITIYENTSESKTDAVRNERG